MDTPRPIRLIAIDIRRHWANVNFAARPYLDAMFDLDSPRDMYMAESGDSIVRYFLSNASGWRGDAARRLKGELKDVLQHYAKH